MIFNPAQSYIFVNVCGSINEPKILFILRSHHAVRSIAGQFTAVTNGENLFWWIFLYFYCQMNILMMLFKWIIPFDMQKISL